MLTITSPRNSATRVEVVGGSLLLFDAGVAHVDGALRPAVERAARKRGYRIALERPTPPPVEPATTPAPAALPPVPPSATPAP